MKIIHKNSKEVIDIFPSHGKYHFGIYGVLALTTNKKVSFIYCSDNMTFFDDVTDEYEIIEEPITYTEEEVKDILVKLQNCRIVYENPLTDRRCTTTNWIIENFEEWFNSNKKK